MVQRQLAVTIGVSVPFLSRIESGVKKLSIGRIILLPNPLLRAVIDQALAELAEQQTRLRALRPAGSNLKRDRYPTRHGRSSRANAKRDPPG
jgi:hypothetical protein